MLNLLSITTAAVETATETVTEAAAEGGQAILTEGRFLYAYLLRAFGIEGGSMESGWLLLGTVLLCVIIPYLIGSINPSIIFSNLLYNEDIRTYGSGNAGTTNTLRTYGPKMAVLIFCLDLFKAGVGVGLGSLILSREIGGAIAGLFVILGHAFPIYYKFKGGKGVACCAMVALILSPLPTVILLAVFVLIVVFTRFISLGSVICAMLLPFLNFTFRPEHGMITLSYICIMILIVVMHRENIKRLLEGKESKLSFKKTDKHAAGDHNGGAAPEKTEPKKEEPKVPEREYTDADFVKCPCGRLIPVSRQKCVYCGTVNAKYIPKPVENKGKKKK